MAVNENGRRCVSSEVLERFRKAHHTLRMVLEHLSNFVAEKATFPFPEPSGRIRFEPIERDSRDPVERWIELAFGELRDERVFSRLSDCLIVAYPNAPEVFEFRFGRYKEYEDICSGATVHNTVAEFIAELRWQVLGLHPNDIIAAFSRHNEPGGWLKFAKTRMDAVRNVFAGYEFNDRELKRADVLLRKEALFLFEYLRQPLSEYDDTLEPENPVDRSNFGLHWSGVHSSDYWCQVLAVDGVPISDDTLRRNINKGSLRTHPMSNGRVGIIIALEDLPAHYREPERHD